MNTEELYHKLRQWRNEKAFSEGRQPFMIFNNAALKATAQTPPYSLDDLPDIKGWGPAKIQKYGQEIIELIAQSDVNTTDDINTGQVIDDEPTYISNPPEEKQAHILSVHECIGLINRHLNDLTILQIQGEINDISKRQRYAFFNLKDKSGEYTLPCFIGWQTFSKYEHLIEEGAEVIISASPSIYKTGRFSVDIKRIEVQGVGALKKAFEALKIKLEQQGYFAQDRKQVLPKNPTKLGLITSRHGAAIKDFKQNLANFGFHIEFKHVYVEGDNAVSSITQALNEMNIHHPDLDAIILMRGGGGLENLKAFNAQEIADAIVSSRLPIITGIGHEKDISIADLCADAYFSTPTAVANFLSSQKYELHKQYENLAQQLLANTEILITQQQHAISLLRHNLEQNTQRLLHNYKNNIKLFATELTNAVSQLIYQFKNKEYNFIKLLGTHISFIQEKLYRIELAERTLENLNPEKLLSKGYSIVYDVTGKVIQSSSKLKVKDSITIQLHKGSITSSITKIKK